MDKLKNTSAPGIILGTLLGMAIGIAMDSFPVGIGLAIIFSIVFRKNGEEDEED